MCKILKGIPDQVLQLRDPTTFGCLDEKINRVAIWKAATILRCLVPEVIFCRPINTKFWSGQNQPKIGHAPGNEFAQAISLRKIHGHAPGNEIVHGHAPGNEFAPCIP